MADIGELKARLTADHKALLRDLDKAEKGFKEYTSKSTRSLDKVKKSVFGLKGAVLGLVASLGGTMLAKSFLDAATTTENYQIRLKALLGSAEEGNRLFQDMAKYAGEVPFEYNKIMGASTQLAGVMKGGVDEVKEWMPLIADLAVVSGLGIEQTTEQIIRMYSAGAASADLFRERGITSMLGFQAGVSYSAAETRKQLMEAWQDPQSKFRDATKEMAKSWDGMMSMISDKWFQFRQMIMDAGVFEVLKDYLSDINEKFGDWIKENEAFIKQDLPEYIDNIASGLSSLATSLKLIADVSTPVWDFFSKMQKLSMTTLFVETLKQVDEQIKKMIDARARYGGKPYVRGKIRRPAKPDPWGDLPPSETPMDPFTAWSKVLTGQTGDVAAFRKKAEGIAKEMEEAAKKSMGKAVAAMEAEAVRLQEAVMTPQEIYDNEVGRLNKFLAGKLISEETYRRNLIKLKDALNAEDIEAQKKWDLDAAEAMEKAYADAKVITERYAADKKAAQEEQARQIKQWEEYVMTPADRIREKMTELNELYATAGPEALAVYGEAMSKLREELEKVTEAANKNLVALKNFGEQAFGNIKIGFADLLKDSKTGFQNWEQILTRTIENIYDRWMDALAEMIMEAMRAWVIQQVLGGVTGSMTSGTGDHTAGVSKNFSRSKGGERTFAADSYPVNQAPQTNVTVINNTNAQARTRERDNQSGGLDIEVIIDEMMSGVISRGGKTAQAIEERYNTAPSIGAR